MQESRLKPVAYDDRVALVVYFFWHLLRVRQAYVTQHCCETLDRLGQLNQVLWISRSGCRQVRLVNVVRPNFLVALSSCEDQYAPLLSAASIVCSCTSRVADWPHSKSAVLSQETEQQLSAQPFLEEGSYSSDDLTASFAKYFTGSERRPLCSSGKIY